MSCALRHAVPCSRFAAQAPCDLHSVRAQAFSDLRREWLRACDVVGRDVACVPVVSGAAASSGDASVAGTGAVHESSTTVTVGAALADRVRVSVVGDLCTRPRVCASVYGGMVAMFLPVLDQWRFSYYD